MGFLDKLKEKKGDKHKGTLSSDAPSRETSDEEAAEITQTAAEKKKKLAAERKAAKAAAKAAKEAAKAKTDEDDGDDDEKPKASAKKNGKPKTNGFSLYIDCMPTKNVHGGDVEPTLFEDWFAPLVMQMNEFALEEKKQPSYLLLPFAEEKALVQMAVADAIDRLPPVMIVNSGTPGAKDALAGLIPHASLVVRATR